METFHYNDSEPIRDSVRWYPWALVGSPGVLCPLAIAMLVLESMNWKMRQWPTHSLQQKQDIC